MGSSSTSNSSSVNSSQDSSSTGYSNYSNTPYSPKNLYIHDNFFNINYEEFIHQKKKKNQLNE